MTAVALSLFAGALLGLSLAAPPGPMNALIAQDSVTRGWTAGFRAGLGAMAADGCFFVLAYTGVTAFLLDAPAVRTATRAVGGVLLCYFAYGAARSARAGATDAPEPAGFWKTFLAALTNPMQVLWWLTAGVALLDPGNITVLMWSFSMASGPLTLLGFFCGIFLWVSGFPAALRAAGERVDALERVVGYASAVVLAGFGVSFVLAAVGRL